MIRRLARAATAAACLAPGAALAQDITLTPSFGSVTLSQGFAPDPHTVDVVGGGIIQASKVGQHCLGYIADAPDYEVSWTGTGGPLAFSVASPGDTTLVVNTPMLEWLCDDDSGDSFNPRIVIESAPTGTYDIWIGTYGVAGRAGVLSISGSAVAGATGPGVPATPGIPAFDAPPAAAASPDPDLATAYGGVSLVSGFANDPYVVNVVPGGELNASMLGGECVGYIAAAPDFELQYTAGTQWPLIISAGSAVDTTLVINDPAGNWVCDDDDGNSGGNPSVTFQQPLSGTYDIWVGTYSGTRFATGILQISEGVSQ